MGKEGGVKEAGGCEGACAGGKDAGGEGCTGGVGLCSTGGEGAANMANGSEGAGAEKVANGFADGGVATGFDCEMLICSNAANGLVSVLGG